MTPVDTTLETKQTAPPVDAITLDTVVTDEVAPHDGKNLILHIDVGPDVATVHCKKEENVGAHKPRYVLFSANTHCWVVFKTKGVFTVDYLELQEGETVRAFVSDNTNSGDTIFTVQLPKMAITGQAMKAGAELMQPATNKGEATPLWLQGPVIVVP